MQVGLTLNKQKTKIMRINAGTDEPVKIEGEEVESFTYLGNVMDKSAGTDTDVKTRIGKAQSAFNMLKRSGAPEKSVHPPRYVYLTQTLSGYCCMEQKHGGQPTH